MGYTDEEFLVVKDYFLVIREAALKVREAYAAGVVDADAFFDAVDDMVVLLDEGEAR